MASSASGALISIEDTRARANKFAIDRSWAQFHTADNLLLALNGEIGEVCEIFQFRGSLDDFKFSKDQSVFSAGEVIHIGEEISDVIIYTTRLSDVTHIDLASAVSAKVTGKSLASPRPRPDEEVSSGWGSYTWKELEVYATSVTRQKSSSPRYYAKKLISYGGKLSSLFIERPEAANLGSLESWDDRDLTDLASILASIVVTCCCLARTVDIDIGTVLDDKMLKNEAKYPVHLAKNSSAKYTKYIKKHHQVVENVKMVTFGLVLGVVVSFLIHRRP
jgi:NTP pyrophosphatase (non-canonical NTP hydrolase)